MKKNLAKSLAILMTIVSIVVISNVSANSASMDPIFDTGLPVGFDNTVKTFATQTNGKTLVGGNFTAYQGTTSNKIIRLNVDGTKDTSFDIGNGFDGVVNTIAIQNNGKILVGGTFTTYKGVPIDRLIRLNPDGSNDTGFNVGNSFNNDVNKIAIQNNGKIVVGGNFNTANGGITDGIVRLNEDGSQDTSFDVGAGFSDTVNTLVIQNDGKILVGGIFTTYKGVTANRIIRLDSNGSQDNDFDIGEGFDDITNTIAIQNDGKILVGGWFTSYKGVTANRIIRLDSHGSQDDTFTIGDGFNDYVNTITIQNDGKIFVGGNFYMYDVILAVRMISLNTDGSQNTDFDVGGNIGGYNDVVHAIVAQSGGKILVGGDFRTYKTVGTNRIIRLNSTGSRDTSFNIGNGFDAIVRTVAFQDDGKIIAGGDFMTYNGDSVGSIIRLNVDGTKDNAFSIGTGFDGDVHKIVIQSNGKILVGGSFSNYNGESVHGIIRLNTDGTRDNTFNSLVGTTVEAIAIQSDGKILVGGGTSKNLVRLTTTGSQDASFNVGGGFNNPVTALAIQSGGKILVGGHFQTYSGASANYIIRLNTGGTKDTSFNIGTAFDAYVESIAIQNDGKVIVGGWFTKYKGVDTSGIIRLTTLGAKDASFNVGSFGYYMDIYSVAIQNDGKIIVGGATEVVRLNSGGSMDTSFTSIGDGYNGGVDNVAIQSGGKIFVGGFFTKYNGVPAGYLTSLYGDSDVVVLPNSTNTTTLADRFISKGYIQTGGDFVGSKAISLNETDGSVPLSFNVKNQDVKVSVPADTQFKQADNITNYNGIISVPVTKSISSINDEEVLSAFKVGSSSESIKLAGGVATLSIPVVGETIGDRIQVYYSEDNGITWYLQTNTNVINVGGQPYVEFTTNHFTDFAITLPNGGGPFAGSFTVNGDAMATTGNTVTLDISTTPAAVNMRFSNDGITRSNRENYTTSISRALDGAYGNKIVYAQFDADGNLFSDLTTSDAIDYIGGSMRIFGGARSTTYQTETQLELSSTPVAVNMRFSNNGSTRSDREPFDYTKNRTLDGIEGTETVYTQLDTYGDQSYIISINDTITYAIATGTIIINGGSSTTDLVDVTLDLSTMPVDAQRMAFSNDNIIRSDREPYSISKARTLDGGYGNKVVYAQFDMDGLTAISTSGSINYVAPGGSPTCAPGSQCGDLTLQIISGYSYCDYGTTLDFGDTGHSYLSRSLITGFQTTGRNDAWFCEDNQGLANWALSIESSDILNITTNNPLHTIPASNVFVRNPDAYRAQGICTHSSGASLNQRTGILTPKAILGKLGNQGEGCKIITDTVDLKVDLTGSQALGIYSGTITISLPNF